MRGRTLRTETLDRSNARDLEQVVRILREVDVSPVSPSSTTGYEKRRLETNHWRQITQGTAAVVRIFVEVDVVSAFSSSTTGCETSRSEMERWKILHSAKDLKQKKRNVKRSADVSGNARHFCDGGLN